MKVFIFVTLMCAVFMKSQGYKMLDFSDDLRYVAKKIRNTQQNSIAQCLKDLVTVEDDLKKIQADVEAGDLLKAVEDGKAAIPDLKQTIADCKDVKSMLDEQGDVEGLEGIVQCIKDIRTEVTDVETFIQDYNQGNYIKMAEDAIAILKEGETILQDCQL